MTESASTAAPKTKPRLWLRRKLRRLTFLASQSVVQLTGFERARSVGGWLGELQFRLAWRDATRHARDMAFALGRSPEQPAVKALLRQSYRVSNGAVFEILALLNRRVDDAVLAAHCELRGLEHLEAARAEGRGVILLGSHTGNGVMFCLRLAQLGLPVSMAFRQSRMMSAELFEQGCARYGVESISANQGARAYRRMLVALRSGRIVYILIDQGVRHAKDGVVLRFLGKDMPMPAGAAQLARQSRAPVLPVATTSASPVWRFEISTPVVRVDDASLEADLEQLLRITEAQVLQYPQLWSWHQRRWRKYPIANCAITAASQP